MGKRILIVEDDVMLAIDIAEALQEHGFTVLGPCVTAKDAMDMYEREKCDVAVLDIGLGKDTSEALAIRMKSEQVPFVVASNYMENHYPEAFVGAPSLPKPVHPQRLIALLQGAA